MLICGDKKFVFSIAGFTLTDIDIDKNHKATEKVKKCILFFKRLSDLWIESKYYTISTISKQSWLSGHSQFTRLYQ